MCGGQSFADLTSKLVVIATSFERRENEGSTNPDNLWRSVQNILRSLVSRWTIQIKKRKNRLSSRKYIPLERQY